MRRRSVVALVVVALALAVAGQAAAGIPQLVGWWPLAEGRGQVVHDFSGHRNHGTLGSTAGVDANDPTWVRARLFGWALSFDGDDFVRIPNAPALEQQRLTVSLWFRASASPGQFKHLIAKGSDACVSASWGLTTASNESLEFYVWNGTNRVSSGHADTNVWDGRWHHAAGTYDGSTARLFVDGREMPGGVTSPVQIDYTLPGTGLDLGAYRGSCDLAFAGAIDQVTIWNEAIAIDRIWSRFGWFLGWPTSR